MLSDQELQDIRQRASGLRHSSHAGVPDRAVFVVRDVFKLLDMTGEQAVVIDAAIEACRQARYALEMLSATPGIPWDIHGRPALDRCQAAIALAEALRARTPSPSRE